MDTKIKTLSDDELMEVTGGLAQIVNPTTCTYIRHSKTACEEPHPVCACSWDEKKQKCTGSCK